MGNSQLIRIVMASTLLISPAIANADGEENTSDLLRHLGLYLGYNLDISPDPVPSATTYDVDNIVQSQFSSVVGMVTAMPILVNGNTTIVPSSLQTYTLPYNTLSILPSSTSNSTTPGYSVWSSYNTPAAKQNYVSAVSNVDQPMPSSDSSNQSSSYLADLTNQTIFDILTVPNYSYCMQDPTSESPLLVKCNYPLIDFTVTNNILNGGKTTDSSGTTVKYGTSLPISPEKAVDPSTSLPLVPSLNANTLLGPMMYNSEGYSGDPVPGYPTLTQVGQASTFIRYLAGLDQASLLADYNTYKTTITNITSDDATTQHQAASALYGYFMGLRNYAANISVGISNLSYIMAKRMMNPATQTSQAFDEYAMATRRILNPDSENTSGKASNQWVAEMEKAAPITLQRETLYLLAEINYQLYLARQQDERILLTLSALQLGGSANTLRSNVTLQVPESASTTDTDTEQ